MGKPNSIRARRRARARSLAMLHKILRSVNWNTTLTDLARKAYPYELRIEFFHRRKQPKNAVE